MVTIKNSREKTLPGIPAHSRAPVHESRILTRILCPIPYSPVSQMTKAIDRALWKIPRWLHYGIAVGLALVAIYARMFLAGPLANASPLAFTVFALCLSAYIGGFWPGILSGAIGFTVSIYLFVEPRFSMGGKSPAMTNQISITVALGIFICFIAGRLRDQALQNARLAAELHIDRTQSQDILDSITDAFYAVNKDWLVLQTNPAFIARVPHRTKVVPGVNLWDSYPELEEPKMKRMLTGVMTNRVGDELEIEDAETKTWLLVRAFPTALGMSVFISDVSERKQFERSRERMLADERVARSASEEAGRIKEDFLATLSHELRTPMTSLIGWAELLNHGPVSEERLKEGLNSIEQSARTQAKMVEELLDLSRINAGKLKIEAEFVTLSELAHEVAAIHHPAALAKNIELRLIDDAPDAVVRADSARLHQVLNNILSNAIKFSRRYQLVILRTFVEASSVCVSIQDQGDGIDPDFLPHVFDRFRQANAGTARRYGGLGLGLSIAKQLVELQGGTVTAESEGTGKGSTFTVRLPVAPTLNLRHRFSKGSEVMGGLNGTRILVLEDDDSTRLFLTRVLEEHGAVVLPFETAKEALDQLPTANPDVIISDIGLPETDGYAFMRALRARDDRWCNLPSVALTAFARDADRRAATEAGFNDFHTKPVNTPALVSTLIRLLNGG